MQYNGETDNQDCVSEVLDISGATLATYSINSITRRFNDALSRYFALAIKATLGWEIDDPQYGSLPVVTQTVSEGSQFYNFEDFIDKIMTFLRLEITDVNNNSYLLKPLDPEMIGDQPLESFMNYEGTPRFYKKIGGQLWLFPIPSATFDGGTLTAFVERQPMLIAVGDTTVEPIADAPVSHQMYLCRYAALPFLKEKDLPQLEPVQNQILIDEDDIETYYAIRQKDRKPVIRMKHRNPR